MGKKIPMATAVPFACAMLLLITAGCVAGVNEFSPDSWAYLELAKTIWSGRFYEFNTYRSYVSDVHSASFPFGYPLLLAVAQLIAGIDPRVAVALNVLAAAVSWWLIVRAGAWLKVSRLGASALASALILYPGYIDEVLSGRSIPVAILAFLGGMYCLLKARPFVGGLLLGASALVRFDFLIYGFLAVLGKTAFDRSGKKGHAAALFGFFIGLTPWVVYSCIFFKKIWMSDNSWVATSVAKAFVLDFPAKAVSTAVGEPVLWASRWLGNVPPLLSAIGGGLLNFPLLVAAFILFSLSFSRLEKKKKWMMLWIFLLGLASLAPYLLTGYFDQRYFALIFFFISAAFILISSDVLNGSGGFALVFDRLMVIIIIFSLTVGSLCLFRLMQSSIEKKAYQDKVAASIVDLFECHKKEPAITYIFKDEVMSLAARYGAETGFRAAFIPSNFARMTDGERFEYLNFMSPYKIFSSFEDMKECGK